MKKFFFLAIFVGSVLLGRAQYFQTGQDPASIKWRQINTENFQIIYPDYFEKQAQKLAYVLEKVYSYAGYSLDYEPRKISVILHTQTVKSNGLVAWAPKRSEFYTTPNQGIYAQDWLEQLAIHEFRHVVQVDKINSEIPKIIKLLLAQQGTALVVGAYLPWWFLEGDAVVTETALSKSGRGRFPSFLIEHQALAVEENNYSYDKAINGSYKNYVPNHYKLGYYLVGNTRLKFGSAVWDSVLTRVGRKPFSLNPFNKALKQNTGFNKAQLYNSVFDSLRTQWIIDDKKYKPEHYNKISNDNKTYTNYKYNYWINDSTLLAYKTSLNKIPEFVTITKSGRETSVFKPGDIFAESVNYRDNLIVWSEHIPNPRWTHSGSSLIRIYNIDTKIIHEIKPEFKAFGPSISPNKKSVAVIESNFSYQFYLSVYSIKTKKLLTRIQLNNNNYMFTPEWVNSNQLAIVVLTAHGKRLALVDLIQKKTSWLTDSDIGEIKQPKLAGKRLLFIGSYNGKNSLYAYNFDSKKTSLLFDPRFGVESPAYNWQTKEIALSNYTADGFEIIRISENASETPLSKVKKGKFLLAENLAEQELGIPDLSLNDSIIFNSEKYNKTAHLFHFHSWAPVYVNTSTYEFTPGVSILSQNKLGTTETVLGYKYDLSGKTGKVHANFVYKGWYPVFNLEISSGKTSSEYNLIENVKNQQGLIIQSDTTLKRFTWNETNLKLGAKVPLNLSKGIFTRLFQPEIMYEITGYQHDNTTPESFFKGNYQSIIYRLYFQQIRRKSFQDVLPDFGFVIDANFRHSPFGKTSLGSMSTIQTVTFLPGVLPNHGFRIYAAAQNKKSNDSYSFNDAIKYPRGWGRINTNKMYSIGADYKLPLFYPDWNLGSILYMKRINASLFYDYAWLNANTSQNQKVVQTFDKDLRSFGAELTTDIHLLRFYAPITMGTRATYIPEFQNIYFDFLFSIDFSSL